MFQDHHHFITAPQEKIQDILERYKDFLKLTDAGLVLSDDELRNRKNEVESLEKERHALLDTTDKRLKSINQAKDELSQFLQVGLK